MTDLTGKQLGPYRLTHRIASGGQATLYKGVHHVMQREVAVKILHPHLVNDLEFRQKFIVESQILASLQHPNIVTIYDAGNMGDTYWLTMEWLDGQTVEDLINHHHQLDVSYGLEIIKQVLDALEYAHAQGLIHRDIKPSNLMVLPDGTTKILDFGIAAMIASGQKAKTRIGTMEYMSYEQFQGQADWRSDIYSLGATFYHMLTGSYPPEIALHPPTPPRQLNNHISRELVHHQVLIFG